MNSVLKSINPFKLLVFLSLMYFCNLKAQEENITPDFKEKQILVVYGGWDGHRPEEFGIKISEWLEAHNAEVTVSKSTEIYTDKSLMSKFDLIIQHVTMDKLTGDESKGLLEAVKNGSGLAGCHGGLGDSFRNNTDYQYMVGGQFVTHPGGQIDYEVNIVDHNDKVTEGISDFKLKTEQYYMHVDPNIKVLATTRFSGEHDSWIENAIVPVVWKKYFGKGRVFYCSIGHSKNLFEIDEVWKLITRGAYWAAQGKSAPKEKWLQPVYSTF